MSTSEADPADHDGFGGGRPPRNGTPLQWARLLLGAARRRKLVAGAVFLASVGAAIGYYVVKTPMYRVEAKIFAQRGQALPSVVRPVYEDQPTRSAWELIHRRDNLIALIEQANLLGERAEGSAVAPGPGERLAKMIGRGDAAAKEDPLDVLVKVLDRRLLVNVDEGTIEIAVEWPDPDQAYALVKGALQNFLEARFVQEVKSIDEVISVIQGRAEVLRQGLDAAVENERRSAGPRPAARRARPPSEELVRVQSLLEAKQRAIRDVEDFRLRRLSDLQAQLDQARNTMSDAHPMVMGLRKDIESLSRESPQVAGLREEERSARKEYAQLLAREGVRSSPSGSHETVQRASADPDGAEGEDRSIREVRLQFEQMVGRVNAAQVELDAARAAFKYRYSVIWPPQLPSEPVSPKPRKLVILGLIGSLALALAAAAAPDVLRGRIVERWQVERSLDLPVLGEIRRNP
jgi:uncharacterized protein involved in exopolysaccharide biosynthesis